MTNYIRFVFLGLACFIIQAKPGFSQISSHQPFAINDRSDNTIQYIKLDTARAYHDSIEYSNDERGRFIIENANNELILYGDASVYNADGLKIFTFPKTDPDGNPLTTKWTYGIYRHLESDLIHIIRMGNVAQMGRKPLKQIGSFVDKVSITEGQASDSVTLEKSNYSIILNNDLIANTTAIFGSNPLNNSLWMLLHGNGEIDILNLNKDTIRLIRSILPKDIDSRYQDYGFSSVKFSNDSRKLALGLTSFSEGPDKNTIIGQTIKLGLCSFNLNNGAFSDIKELDDITSNDNTGVSLYPIQAFRDYGYLYTFRDNVTGEFTSHQPKSFRNLIFSPNDSALFAFSYYHPLNGSNYCNKYSVYNGNKTEIPNIKCKTPLMTATGKIIGLFTESDLFEIQNPNDIAALTRLLYHPGFIKKRAKHNIWTYLDGNNGFYDLLDIQFSYDCDSNVIVKPRSSKRFDSYKLRINKSNTYTFSDSISIPYSTASLDTNIFELSGNFGNYRQSTQRVLLKENLYKNPVANFTLIDSVFCEREDITLFNISSSETLEKLTWDFGDNSSLTITNKNDFLHPVNHSYDESGMYKLTLVVEDNHCVDSVSIYENINILPSTKAEFMLEDSIGCDSTHLKLTPLNTNALRQAKWYLNDQDLYSTTNEVRFDITTYGPNKIKLYVESMSGCKDSITQNFLLLKGIKYETKVTGLWSSFYNNDSVESHWKNANIDSAIYKLRWSTYEINNLKDNYHIQPKGNLHDSINVQSIDYCNNHSEQNYTRPPILKLYSEKDGHSNVLHWVKPISDFDFDKILITRDSKNIIELPIVYASYTDNLNFNVELTEHQFSKPLCYKIAYINTAENIIALSNDTCAAPPGFLYLPTAFSPNDDGINDSWQASYSGYKSFKLKVYNRWGELLFENQTPAWTGTNEFNEVFSSDVYFYTLQAINFNGKINNLSGVIHLLK